MTREELHPYDKGTAAYYAGLTREDNPFNKEEEIEAYEDWDDGFIDSEEADEKDE